MTKKDYQKEHPGFVVKEFPNMFNIRKFVPLKYEVGKKFRLSVDTLSDLDFFNSHYDYLKTKNKKFNLKNVQNSKNFNYLNSHVVQKSAFTKAEPNIVIITSISKKYGMGHYSRSKVIFREITECISSNVVILCLGKKFQDKNFYHKNKIKFIKKI